MSGPFFVLFAAFLFAAANAVAKALYLRGHTLVSVFLARCLVVYVVNSWIVACREGWASARRVLLLRTGRRASTQLAALRGLVGAATGLGLNLSFVFLTLADAFTVFKGVDLLGTSALGRLALHEKLSRREIGSGLLTLLGLLLVAQPTFLFGQDKGERDGAAEHPTHDPRSQPQLPGLLAAALGGLCSAGFNVLTRSLSREGRPLGVVSAPLLLSHFMVATFACVALVGVGATASGLSRRDGWGWSALELGGGALADDAEGGVDHAHGQTDDHTHDHSDDHTHDHSDGADGARSQMRSRSPEMRAGTRSLLVGLMLLALYCAGILLGQLAMARGMATTRAGVGAILAVSEIAFAFLLDIALLREPTSPLAAIGSSLVFASVGGLACAKARAPMNADTPTAGEAGARGDEPLKRADAARATHTEAWEAQGVAVELEETEPRN